MGSKNSYTPIGVAILVAVVLQLALMAVDCRQTAIRVAERFVKNYYYLNPAMHDQLCSRLADRGEAVNDYLYSKRFAAGQRGFSANYVRRMFTKIHLEIIDQNDTSAKIHISGHTRTAINPAMMVIGKWFHIGQSYPVQMTVEMVKEEGRWCVQGNVFGDAST